MKSDKVYLDVNEKSIDVDNSHFPTSDNCFNCFNCFIDKNFIDNCIDVDKREKSKLTKDYIMIVCKYFRKSKDFINLIKVNSKYKNLLEMFKYNPISNYEIFPNIQTQYFYNTIDLNYVKPHTYKHIHYEPVVTESFKKVFVNYLLNSNRLNSYKRVKLIINNRFMLDFKKFYKYIKNIKKKSHKKLLSPRERSLYNNFKDFSKTLIIPEQVKITQGTVHRLHRRFEIDNLIIEGCIKIGNYSFINTNIKSCELPNTLLVIGMFAFYDSYLEEVDIPDSVRVIDADCFGNCKKLKRITLPVNLEYIGKRAFEYTAIEQIRLPPRFNKIEYDWFKGCYNLNLIEVYDQLEVYSKIILLDLEKYLNVTKNTLLVTDFLNVLIAAQPTELINLPDRIKIITYNDFLNSPIPTLTEKIDYTSEKVDEFDEGELINISNGIERMGNDDEYFDKFFPENKDNAFNNIANEDMDIIDYDLNNAVQINENENRNEEDNVFKFIKDFNENYINQINSEDDNEEDFSEMEDNDNSETDNEQLVDLNESESISED